jgi:anti-anti-sigma factor
MQSAETQSASVDGSFSISSRRLEHGILVALSGDVDMATATVADDELRRAEESEDVVVLDLGEVSFMDSTGLRMVISADKRLRARGASLQIQRITPQVRRLFELVGVMDHLVIADGDAASLDGAAISANGDGPAERRESA